MYILYARATCIYIGIDNNMKVFIQHSDEYNILLLYRSSSDVLEFLIYHE